MNQNKSIPGAHLLRLSGDGSVRTLALRVGGVILAALLLPALATSASMIIVGRFLHSSKKWACLAACSS